MKLINKFKSINFDARKANNISYIIIHYTALSSCDEAIEFLCNEENKASSHYIISKNGEIYRIVSDQKRAWHAGISYWKGVKDINSNSIGIELDFNPSQSKIYSKKMINSLIKLLRKLKKKYYISNHNILGHSDIAPYRKVDPGEKFPWKKLYLEKITKFPKKLKQIESERMDLILENLSLKSKKNKALFILEKIGYETKPARLSSKKFKILIKAYQMHYVKKSNFGKLDLITYETLKSHLNLLLTN